MANKLGSRRKTDAEIKESDRLRAKRYYEKHKDVLKEKQKAYSLSSKLYERYGITPEDYNRMFKEQDGRCAICKRHQSEFKRALSVDHCHSTGMVRGLLCCKCNPAIGLLEDNTEYLECAIQYLNRAKEAR